jgi:hypothetical protein
MIGESPLVGSVSTPPTRPGGLISLETNLVDLRLPIDGGGDLRPPVDGGSDLRRGAPRRLGNDVSGGFFWSIMGRSDATAVSVDSDRRPEVANA